MKRFFRYSFFGASVVGAFLGGYVSHRPSQPLVQQQGCDYEGSLNDKNLPDIDHDGDTDVIVSFPYRQREPLVHSVSPDMVEAVAKLYGLEECVREFRIMTQEMQDLATRIRSDQERLNWLLENYSPSMFVAGK